MADIGKTSPVLRIKVDEEFKTNLLYLFQNLLVHLVDPEKIQKRQTQIVNPMTMSDVPKLVSPPDLLISALCRLEGYQIRYILTSSENALYTSQTSD